MSEEQKQAVFGIEKVYVKGISLELPNAPQIFLEQGTPAINVEVHTAPRNSTRAYSRPS